MGIRIHKSVGYGVQDFVPPKDWRDIQERAWDCSLQQFLGWIKKNRRQLPPETPSFRTDLVLFECLLKDSAKKLRLGDCVIHDEEFGIEGVLQLIPPGHPELRRYDDSIDYYSESTAKNELEPRYAELEVGIYPHLRGEVPFTVLALTNFLGIQDVAARLKESIYTFWA